MAAREASSAASPSSRRTPSSPARRRILRAISARTTPSRAASAALLALKMPSALFSAWAARDRRPSAKATCRAARACTASSPSISAWVRPASRSSAVQSRPSISIVRSCSSAARRARGMAPVNSASISASRVAVSGSMPACVSRDRASASSART